MAARRRPQLHQRAADLEGARAEAAPGEDLQAVERQAASSRRCRTSSASISTRRTRRWCSRSTRRARSRRSTAPSRACRSRRVAAAPWKSVSDTTRDGAGAVFTSTQLCASAYGFLISEKETIPPSGPASARRRSQSTLPAGYRPRGSAATITTPHPELNRHAAYPSRANTAAGPAAVPLLRPATDEQGRAERVTQ